jgi:phage gp46-like protein
MTDIRLIYNNQAGTPGYGSADIRLVGPDFDASEDLATAVTVSLFTDRLADEADKLPQHETDRRGWWGDTYAENAGDLIGSRLWLLFRSTTNDRTPLIAQGYILESLQWLIQDGVASSVDAKCFFLPGATGAVTQRRLGAIVTIYRLGLAPLQMEFSWVWGQLGIST